MQGESMRNRSRALLLLAIFAAAARPGIAQNAAPFDVVIIHGHIIDGTGSPWYSGQIGIRANPK
jgi:N-acyl-D-amino-acid deacylase